VRANLVLGDTVGGARRRTEHPLDPGHRRTVFAGGNPRVGTARNRRPGWEQVLSAHGLETPPEPAVGPGQRVASDVQSVDEPLAPGVRLDAIVAANNAVAVGVVSRLRERACASRRMSPWPVSTRSRRWPPSALFSP